MAWCAARGYKIVKGTTDTHDPVRIQCETCGREFDKAWGAPIPEHDDNDALAEPAQAERGGA